MVEENRLTDRTDRLVYCYSGIKMFGVFEHRVCKPNTTLLRGYDDNFFAPHSRHTEIRRQDIEKISEIDILSDSEEAGIYLLKTDGGKQVFVTGHSEYDKDTLKTEYDRDVAKGIDIKVPRNYFAGDDPGKPPIVRWRGHANLLFSNWLNYYVYQETPFDLNELK